MLEKYKPATLASLAGFALIVMSIVVFWPGSSGGFILDDYSSLGTLANNGGINDVHSALQYALSGKESRLGRPISRLTFTLNGNTWPTDPYPFKVTNILIHATNALLLFGLFYSLMRALKNSKHLAISVAFFAALLWAIHPIQTSTVLYIVQRMTELSALFIITALLLYIQGRKIALKNPGLGYTLMSCAVIVVGILSFLSKETGVLITLLILIIEFTLLNTVTRPSQWKYWAIPILGFPLLVIGGYFLMVIVNHESHYAIRDFGLYERVLTQARVLFDYLSTLIMPINTPAIQHDHFQLSTSLFNPVSTLLAILLICAALLLSIPLRHKQPFLSFAILWFFGAHILESSLIPLEIYFEHRNYIPFIGPALAASYYLHYFLAKNPKSLISIITGISIILTATTWHYSSIWDNEKRLAETWADEAPLSIRRLTFLNNHLLKEGKTEQAFEVAVTNYHNHPDKLGSQGLYIAMQCSNNRLTKDEYVGFIESAATKRIDSETYLALSRIYEVIAKGYCQQITWLGMESALDAILKNPNIEHWSWLAINTYQMKGEVNRNLKRWPQTVSAFNSAFELEPTVNAALDLAYLHFSVAKFEQASHYIKQAKIIDDLRRPWQFSQAKRITAAKQRLAEKVEHD